MGEVYGAVVQSSVPMTLSSSLDPKTVYHPPSSLLYPEGQVPARSPHPSRSPSPTPSSSERSDASDDQGHDIEENIQTQKDNVIQTEVFYFVLCSFYMM